LFQDVPQFELGLEIDSQPHPSGAHGKCFELAIEPALPVLGPINGGKEPVTLGQIPSLAGKERRKDRPGSSDRSAHVVGAAQQLASSCQFTVAPQCPRIVEQ